MKKMILGSSNTTKRISEADLDTLQWAIDFMDRYEKRLQSNLKRKKNVVPN